MKIRILGNSVRYRLTRSDVRRLADTGRVEETTCFGPLSGQTLTYALESRAELQHLDATFDGYTITLYLPTETALAWADDDRVGFEYDLPVTTDTRLKLLIEKDFVCIDETVEDQSDNYPNPREIC